MSNQDKPIIIDWEKVKVKRLEELKKRFPNLDKLRRKYQKKRMVRKQN